MPLSHLKASRLHRRRFWNANKAYYPFGSLATILSQFFNHGPSGPLSISILYHTLVVLFFSYISKKRKNGNPNGLASPLCPKVYPFKSTSFSMCRSRRYNTLQCPWPSHSGFERPERASSDLFEKRSSGYSGRMQMPAHA